MRFPLLLPFLLALPLAEIAGFVLVGRAVGVWATLALVILTSLLGVLILRRQGLQMLRGLSAEGQQGRLPGEAVVDGAMIVVAGLLLLMPGFVTDIIGLALFLPPVRHLLWRTIGKRVVVVETGGYGGYSSRGPSSETAAKPDGRVVDLSEEDFTRRPNPSSPWKEKGPDSG